MNSLEIHKVKLRMLRELEQEWLDLFIIERNDEAIQIISEDHLSPLKEEIKELKELIKRGEIDIV